MTTITGMTAARMLAIEAASVVSGTISGDNLILTKKDASTVNAGNVRGATGATGVGLTAINLGTTIDLNTLTTVGVWTQTVDANAVVARHYPSPGYAGFLEVWREPGGTIVWQKYTLTQDTGGTVFKRSYTSGTWSAWDVQSPRYITQVFACNTAVSLTSVAQEVQGCSATIQVYNDTDEFIVTACVDFTSLAASTTNGVGQFLVDSTVQQAQSIFNPGGVSGIRATGYQQWDIFGLSVGSHTFHLQGIRSGGADAQIRINTLHTTMMIRQVR